MVYVLHVHVLMYLCLHGCDYRERAALQKTNRRLDRKVKELTGAVEEERRHAEQFKDQVSEDHRLEMHHQILLPAACVLRSSVGL